MPNSKKYWPFFPPWASNKEAPFRTPWSGGRGPKDSTLQKVELRNAARETLFATVPMKEEAYTPLVPYFAFMCRVMNAVTEVRPKWDYQSSQQIVPVFAAALEIAQIIDECKADKKGDWKSFWDDLKEPQQGNITLLVELLNAWNERDREIFRQREVGRVRERYYLYKKGELADDSILTPEGYTLIYFSDVSIAPSQLQANGWTLYQVKGEITQMSVKEYKSRFAFWHIVLETMNAFMHLSERNLELTKIFPELVACYVFGRKSFQSLMKSLEDKHPNRAERLEKCISVFDEAIACFKSKKDRNFSFLKLKRKEWKEELTQRRKVYSKKPRGPEKPKRPGEIPKPTGIVFDDEIPFGDLTL